MYIILDQMISRIEYVHNKSFIHRDIKVKNIRFLWPQTLKNIFSPTTF